MGSDRPREAAASLPLRRMIRVVLADDLALVRGGMRVILEDHEDIRVVGKAADGSEAVEQAIRTGPDVVVMDVRMPGVDGLEATRRIAARIPAVRVLVVTTFHLDEYVLEALRAGASGFLLKDAPPASLVEAVRTVAGGEALLAPAVTRQLIEHYARRRRRPGARRAPRRLTVSELGSGWTAARSQRRVRRVRLPGRGDGEDPRDEHPLQARATEPDATGSSPSPSPARSSRAA